MPDSYQREEIEKIERSILDIEPFQVLETIPDKIFEDDQHSVYSIFTRCLRPCCWDFESTISSMLTEASLHTTSTDLMLLELGPSVPQCSCLTLVGSTSKTICPMLLLPKEYLI